MRKLLILLYLCALQAHADALDEQVERLSAQLRCLVCQNQTIG